MFYKENYLTKEQRNYFEKSPEFFYTLYEKMEAAPNNYLGAFIAIDKNGTELIYTPTLLHKKKEIDAVNPSDDFSSYTHINGLYGLMDYSYKSILKRFQEENNDCVNFKIISLSKEEYKKIFTLNEEKLEKSKEILNDFFIVKEQGIITDKNGENYTFMIVNNADESIGSTLIVDHLFLFDKDNNQIGYLKVKYTTEEILEKLKVSEKERKNEFFLNLATVDFSRIVEEYHHRGLGYSMYFHMTQYLNKNNIEFRQSTINSDKAQRLWEGINKHFSEFIEQKISYKTMVSFLKIGEDCMLSFEDNKPIITKKNRV